VLVSSEGPAHGRTYRIEARCGSCTGAGEGGSKKEAETRAAADVLRRLQEPHGEAPEASGRRPGPAPALRTAGLALCLGLGVLGATPLAAAEISPEASSSALEKLQLLADGDLDSGSTIELSEVELNSFLRFDAAASVPEGIEDLELDLRSGGALVTAQVDLAKAGGSRQSLPPVMRLLLQGARRVKADVDYSASGGYATAKLVSLTVEEIEMTGTLLEWFVETLAPPDIRPYLTGERIALQAGVAAVRLEPGRGLVVTE